MIKIMHQPVIMPPNKRMRVVMKTKKLHLLDTTVPFIHIKIYSLLDTSQIYPPVFFFFIKIHVFFL